MPVRGDYMTAGTPEKERVAGRRVGGSNSLRILLADDDRAVTYGFRMVLVRPVTTLSVLFTMGLKPWKNV